MSQAYLSYQHPESGEWAHDVRDPLSEAFETYVRPAFEAVQPLDGENFYILEVGFGRGMNTAVALRELAESGFEGEVQAFGMDPHPECLTPWPEPPQAIKKWAPWWGKPVGTWALQQRHFSGEVQARDACAALAQHPRPWNWIFVDLFSPGKHPGDWQKGLFARLTDQSAPGAVLTTYTCARDIRERLVAHGWAVEVLRRPGCRDTLRARAPKSHLASPNQ